MTTSCRAASAAPPPRIHIDVTAWWDRRNAPVGISRVVVELAKAVHEISILNRAWRYDRQWQRLVEVPWAEFERVVGPPLDQTSGAARLRAAAGRTPFAREISETVLRWGRRLLVWLRLHPAFLVLEPSDRFVFGGWIGDAARLRVYRQMLDPCPHNVSLYCHDVIPAILPELVESQVAAVFDGYLDVFVSSRTQIFCPSAATKRDLCKLLPDTRPPRRISVVSPGSDIEDAGSGHEAEECATSIDRDYILYVSTIEIRKNHAVLLDAYGTLLERGRADLPLLVFVGKRGWSIDPLLQEIDRGHGRSSSVRIMDDVSDRQMGALYRGARFTVFPSLYEGWGIPVGESLRFGRFCLSSDRGGSREAGAGLVELLDPTNSRLWADRIEHYLDHPDQLLAREADIRSRYRPRSWTEFRSDIMAELADA